MPEPLEEITAGVAPLLEAVPGASPAGAPARLDPAYEAVVAEVAKLEAPSGAPVDWDAVARGARQVLTAKSKDLLMAAYLARALQVKEGLRGLATGEALLVGLLERYWDSMQPDARRLRGRANALNWLLERAVPALPSGPLPTPGDTEAALALSRRLADLAREKLADLTPAFGGLLEALEAVKATVAPPPAAAPAPAAGPPAAAPAAGSPSPALAAAPPSLGSALEATSFLRAIGEALVDAARKLREASPVDEVAYRILRVGLWVHLEKAPPAPSGRTAIPAPPEALRSRLDLLLQNQKWSALLDEAESALPGHRLALDLQRLAWQALSALGAGYERARAAVTSEVRALLGRMPELPGLSFDNGTPLASPPTRSWIEETVLGREGSGPAPHGDAPPSEAVASALAEGRKLLTDGRTAEGLRRLGVAVAASGSGRARFLARLALAKACAAAGLPALAKGGFEELDREAQGHRLEDWEPELAVETLKGLIASARALGKDPRGGASPMIDEYDRLCRLDPAAAHEIWP